MNIILYLPCLSKLSCILFKVICMVIKFECVLNFGLTFRCALHTTYKYVGRDHRARRGRNRSGCNAHKKTRVQIVAALLLEEGVSEADGWCLELRTIACGWENTLSHFVTAPSGREPWVCANFGHRQALLPEEGVSEADGWCLGFRTAIIYCAP